MIRRKHVSVTLAENYTSLEGGSISVNHDPTVAASFHSGEGQRSGRPGGCHQAFRLRHLSLPRARLVEPSPILGSVTHQPEQVQPINRNTGTDHPNAERHQSGEVTQFRGRADGT